MSCDTRTELVSHPKRVAVENPSLDSGAASPIPRTRQSTAQEAESCKRAAALCTHYALSVLVHLPNTGDIDIGAFTEHVQAATSLASHVATPVLYAIAEHLCRDIRVSPLFSYDKSTRLHTAQLVLTVIKSVESRLPPLEALTKSDTFPEEETQMLSVIHHIIRSMCQHCVHAFDLQSYLIASDALEVLDKLCVDSRFRRLIGGVAEMAPFLVKYFPLVYHCMDAHGGNFKLTRSYICLVTSLFQGSAIAAPDRRDVTHPWSQDDVNHAEFADDVAEIRSMVMPESDVLYMERHINTCLQYRHQHYLDFFRWLQLGHPEITMHLMRIVATSVSRICTAPQKGDVLNQLVPLVLLVAQAEDQWLKQRIEMIVFGSFAGNGTAAMRSEISSLFDFAAHLLHGEDEVYKPAFCLISLVVAHVIVVLFANPRCCMYLEDSLRHCRLAGTRELVVGMHNALPRRESVLTDALRQAHDLICRAERLNESRLAEQRGLSRGNSEGHASGGGGAGREGCTSGDGRYAGQSAEVRPTPTVRPRSASAVVQTATTQPPATTAVTTRAPTDEAL